MRILTTLSWILMSLVTVGQSAPEDFQWNLSSLYSSQSDWEADKSFILENVDKIGRQTEIRNANQLAIELDFVSDLRSRAAKMVVYGALTSNLDFTDNQAEENYKVAVQMEDLVESEVVRFEQIILSLPEDKVRLWMDESDKLEEHRKRLNRILDKRDYQLDEDGERLMRSLGRTRQLPGETYSAFMDAKIGWPLLQLKDGSEIQLTPGTFRRISRTENKEDRKNAIETYYGFLGENSQLLGTLLTSRIETDLKLAQERGFDSGMDAEFHLRDGFPVGGHLKLLEAARTNKETLQRFVKIRASLLDQDVIDYTDLFDNPFSVNDSFSLDESLKVIEGATEFLGKDYQEKLFQVLKDSVMHLALQENKRWMWAIYPPVGGAKPYVIMSYNESFLANNVLSRALVGYLAQHHYSPDTRDDPPVYNNAVIYVGSLLHYDHMISTSTEKETKLYYLVEEANRLWKSFFRYLIIAELEKFIEDALKKNRVPNGEEISNKYKELLKSYYGNEHVDIDKIHGAEWMTIAQPFHTIEHQYWPPAMATACAILSKVEEGDEGILNLLLGKVTSESDRSYQILKVAGVDLINEGSYNPLAQRMSDLLDKIESLTN